MVPKPGPKPRKNPRPVKPTRPGFDHAVEMKKVGLVFSKPKPQPPPGVWAPGRPIQTSVWIAGETAGVEASESC